MNLDTLLSGALGTLLGTIVGAWLSSVFQKRLLKQQLDYQKEQAALDAIERKKVSDATIAAIVELRDTVNYRLRKLIEKIGDVSRSPSSDQ
jgi:hypothetical protein